VIGKVERNPSSYEVELSLVQTATFATERRVDRATASDVNELIAVVERGAAKLFELDAPPPAAVAPVGPVAEASATGATASAAVAHAAALGATGPASTSPLADAGAPEPVERTPVQSYVGFGAAGLAVVAFSAAVIAGSVANSPPTGATRKERQDDLERRNDYAVAANIAFATGGVLSAVAVVAFVWE
jgi:hypothetical protein